MVSLYCSLLFSRKEFIKFSEVALGSAHCNCLIGWIVIVRGYRPWNTVNTTMDIWLLVQSGNKKNKTKCEVCSNIFYRPFGCTKANFGSLTRRQPHKYDPKSTGSLVITLVPTVWPSASVRFEPETFRF